MAYMKRTITIAAAALFLAACASTGGTGGGLSLDEAVELSGAAVAAKLPPGTRVAIVGFEAEHQNLAAYIMDELTGALVDGSLEVADRNNLEYVFKELNFQMTGYVDDESAAGVGKFLGAAYVITGQLVDIGDAYRYRVNALTVETAKHAVSERHTVRNDRAAKNLAAALQKTGPVSRAASYGAASPGAPESAAPATAGAFLDRGIMFASRGDYEMAIGEFTESIKLNAKSAIAYTLRGKAIMASLFNVDNRSENFNTITFSSLKKDAPVQRIDEAIADYNQAIQLDPRFVMAYHRRGHAYNEKGDKDRAIADYTQALRLDPNYKAAYIGRGNAYNGKGDHDRAMADYNQALRLDPNYAIAYNNRGNAYYGKGDYDRAIADYTQALRLDPNYTTAYANRGDAYRMKSQNDEAIKDLNEAIRLDPNYSFAYASRGAVYSGKGQKNQAIADLEKAISLNPNDQWAKDRLREIRGW
jgi:tetratricopeptide (TPR) repeat protein